MDTVTIESRLRDLPNLPVRVHSWRVETGEDATGDPAVWVWITLQDQDFNRPAQDREKLSELVWDCVRGGSGEDPKPWVYVRFRAASETDESEGA